MFEVRMTFDGKPIEPDDLIDEMLKTISDMQIRTIRERLQTQITNDEAEQLTINLDFTEDWQCKVGIKGPEEIVKKISHL